MSSIKLFETRQVRSLRDQDKEAWFFSPNPRTYWSVLKNRLKKEGSELATNCSQLKMESADGKNDLTDVADTEQLLRLFQSTPSPRPTVMASLTSVIASAARQSIPACADPAHRPKLHKNQSPAPVQHMQAAAEILLNSSHEWPSSCVSICYKVQ